MGQGAAQAPSQGEQQAAANAAAAVVTSGGSAAADAPTSTVAAFNPMAWLAPGGGVAAPSSDSTDNA